MTREAGLGLLSFLCLLLFFEELRFFRLSLEEVSVWCRCFFFLWLRAVSTSGLPLPLRLRLAFSEEPSFSSLLLRRLRCFEPLFRSAVTPPAGGR